MSDFTNDFNSNTSGEAASYVPPRRSSMPVLWDADANPVSSSSFLDDDDDDLPPKSTASTTSNALHHFQDATKSLIQKQHIAELTRQVSDTLQTMLTQVRAKPGTALKDDTARTKAYNTISSVPPFSYLPKDVIRSLVSDLTVVHYQDGDVIVQQGDTKDNPDVFVLETGRIMMVQFKANGVAAPLQNNNTNNSTNNGGAPIKFLGYLDAPAYFGEWGTLFDAERGSQIVAGGDNVTVYRMTGNQFEQLLQHSAFRIKLAWTLRSNGIFEDLERFVAIVRRAVAHESQMDFTAILTSYRRMTPAIHANLHSAALDIEGWTYSVRRLPDSITSTYVYLLAETVPLPFMHADFSLKDIFVPTVARRRKAFQVDNGKLLVILRDNFSDVLDFLSLLCAHIHESTKLRTRLTNPSSLDALHKCLWSPERKNPTIIDGPVIRRQRATYCVATLEEQQAALKQLPLSATELQGLQSLWPTDFCIAFGI